MSLSSRAPMLWAARVAAAAGLVVDAVIHVRLSSQYDLITATISEGTLFRIEAAAAALAALLVLAWRRPLGDLFAWVTAAASIVALLVYRYVDVGAFGPFPDMYEPIWSAEKTWALAGEAVALIALSYLLLATYRSGRMHRNPSGR